METVVILRPLDVPARLDEFRDMSDGWLEGEGKAPDHDGLNWLSTLFEKYYPSDLPLPYTYPMPDGGVQMEWKFPNNVEIELEVDLSSHNGLWNYFDMSSHKNDSTQNLKLDNKEDWGWLIDNIKELNEV